MGGDMPNLFMSGSFFLIFMMFFTLLGGSALKYTPFKGKYFFAPVLGVSVVSVFVFPFYLIFPLNHYSSIILFTILCVWAWQFRPREIWLQNTFGNTKFLIFLAVILATVTAMGAIPKLGYQTIRLSIPLMDHAKVLIIDTLLNEGLPLKNPFAWVGGASDNLSYYYLWYLLAAFLASCWGVSAWDADIALTAATSLVSLFFMMGCIDLLCTEREKKRAITWLLLLCLAGSLLPALYVVVSRNSLSWLILDEHGLELWFEQATWVPQHVLAATLLSMGLLITSTYAAHSHYVSLRKLVIPSFCLAAAFGMSAWVGGVATAVSAISLFVLNCLQNTGRFGQVVKCWSVVAICSLVIATPFLLAEIGAVSHAHQHAVGIHPWNVIRAYSDHYIFNLLAYWLVFLPIQIGAVFLPFVFFVKKIWNKNEVYTSTLVIISAACLCTSWVMKSQIANNDLGWRAIIPAVLCMSIVSSVALSRFHGEVSVLLFSFLIGASLLENAGGWVKGNILGNTRRVDISSLPPYEFWEEIRNNTDIHKRILSNPNVYESIEPWNVNIGWATMARRKSCFMGENYATSLGGIESDEIRNSLLKKLRSLYDGLASSDDIHHLMTILHCDVIAVSPVDKLWQLNPDKALPGLTLYSSGKYWRFYK